METITTKIELPRDVLVLFKTRKEDLSYLVKKSFALEQYREGRLSLGKTAELLSMSTEELMGVLKDHKIPLNYDVEEFEKDIKTLRKLDLLQEQLA